MEENQSNGHPGLSARQDLAQSASTAARPEELAPTTGINVQPEPTEGERRTRLNFNVKEDPTVRSLKLAGAAFIDAINAIELPANYDIGEFRRLQSLAKTEVESGTSWAVKAATAKFS